MTVLNPPRNRANQPAYQIGAAADKLSSNTQAGATVAGSNLANDVAASTPKPGGSLLAQLGLSPYTTAAQLKTYLAKVKARINSVPPIAKQEGEDYPSENNPVHGITPGVGNLTPTLTAAGTGGPATTEYGSAYKGESSANGLKNPGRTSPTNSQISVPGYVPAAYKSWVASAAKSTGLPASLIAAQINDESGFNPTVTSSAGAEGIAQFEPGTFKQYGTGDPYNASDSLNAYSNYMNALLKQYNGNVRDALAAYNAGSNNIAAGYGYADNIIAAAGIKSGQVSTGAGFTVPIVRPGGGDAPSSGSGSGSGFGDDTSGVSTLFTNYENELNAPRTAPQGFTSISQSGWKAPFQWWYSSFAGLNAQDGGDGT